VTDGRQAHAPDCPFCRHQNLKKQTTVQVEGYAEAKRAVDAVYASGRLTLPFEGLLLFGY
jgi:hypothetical protein